MLLYHPVLDSNKRHFTPTASALVVNGSHSSGNKICYVYFKVITIL